MLKTIQIIKFMKSRGCNDTEILEELHWIVNNRKSTYFELSDWAIDSITEVYDNEDKFNLAWKVAMIK